MPTVTYAGTAVTINDEGFFTDPGQWRADMAPLIARQEGIASLTLMRLLTLAHQHRQPRQPIRRGNGYKMRSALLGDVARVRRKRQKTKRKCAGQCHASGQRKDQGEN